MEPSKKRKDVDEDKESSRLERDDDNDEQEIDQGRHSELSPSKIKKCSAETSLSTSADHSSAPPYQQRHSDKSVQPPTVMEDSRYYTRSAARKLTPPPPSQLRAGKLLIQNVDRGTRHAHAQVYKSTLMRQTATSRVTRTPVVPTDAQRNVSGIVPLGPPPPRDDSNWFKPRMITNFSESYGTGAENSQNSQAARFAHIPPPSLPYGEALEMLVAFNERVKNLKDGSDRREQFLALQKDLGFPESAGLLGLYQISGSVFINYLMDYFKWWESRKANVPESSQTEGQVSPE